MTLGTILTLILLAALFFALYWFACRIMPGLPARIAGIILGIVYLYIVLSQLGLLSGLNTRIL